MTTTDFLMSMTIAMLAIPFMAYVCITICTGSIWCKMNIHRSQGRVYMGGNIYCSICGEIVGQYNQVSGEVLWQKK